MRSISIDDLRPGMVLSRPLRSERGDLLLRTDAPLTVRQLELLRGHGFATVYVYADEVVPRTGRERVSECLRTRLIEAVTKFDAAVRDATEYLVNEDAATIRAELRVGQIQRTVRESLAYRQLMHLATELADEASDLLLHKPIGLPSADDDWRAGQTVDAAIVAVSLARRFNYGGDDLRRLATGALVRDVGLAFVPRACLEQRARMTPAERARLRLHPLLGYELLRGLRPKDFLANHIALQHHERQDGQGYPRGLRGTNRIFRTIYDADRVADAPILLDAEIVAAADVYAALGAPRPYRRARTPAEVLRILVRLAGTHLNREVVTRLIASFPVFPLGAAVAVRTGPYARHRGVVIQVRREAPSRPIVRLHFDGRNRRIAPIDLDLRDCDDGIECLPVPLASIASLPTPARYLARSA